MTLGCQFGSPFSKEKSFVTLFVTSVPSHFRRQSVVGTGGSGQLLALNSGNLVRHSGYGKLWRAAEVGGVHGTFWGWVQYDVVTRAGPSGLALPRTSLPKTSHSTSAAKPAKKTSLLL